MFNLRNRFTEEGSETERQNTCHMIYTLIVLTSVIATIALSFVRCKTRANSTPSKLFVSVQIKQRTR